MLALDRWVLVAPRRSLASGRIDDLERSRHDSQSLTLHAIDSALPRSQAPTRGVVPWECTAEGAVKHIGISIHRSLDVMRKAIDCGEFETIMLSYSPVDSENVADILPWRSSGTWARSS